MLTPDLYPAWGNFSQPWTKPCQPAAVLAMQGKETELITQGMKDLFKGRAENYPIPAAPKPLDILCCLQLYYKASLGLLP